MNIQYNCDDKKTSRLNIYINMHLSILTLNDLELAMVEHFSQFMNRRLPLAEIVSANQKSACLPFLNL